MLQSGTDYLFLENCTLVLISAMAKGCVVCLPNKIFAFSTFDWQATTRKITETTFYIDGEPTAEALKKKLQDPELTSSQVESLITELAQKHPQAEIISLPEVTNFKVKAGWFSRGIYFKPKGKIGYSGITISGKENALACAEFYQKHFRTS